MPPWLREAVPALHRRDHAFVASDEGSQFVAQRWAGQEQRLALLDVLAEVDPVLDNALDLRAVGALHQDHDVPGSANCVAVADPVSAEQSVERLAEFGLRAHARHDIRALDEHAGASRLPVGERLTFLPRAKAPHGTNEIIQLEWLVEERASIQTR